MSEPHFQLGPLWLYNRAVVRHNSTLEEYVIRSCRVANPSTAELVHNETRKSIGRFTYDAIAQDYAPIGKRVSVLRSYTSLSEVPTPYAEKLDDGNWVPMPTDSPKQ